MAKRSKLPAPYKRLLDEYPKVGKAYDALGDAVHKAGPLDGRTRALIKLSIAVGARLEGAVHSHTRKALEAGATRKEILHAVVLAMPTIGLPSTVAALSWAWDVLDER